MTNKNTTQIDLTLRTAGLLCQQTFANGSILVNGLVFKPIVDYTPQPCNCGYQDRGLDDHWSNCAIYDDGMLVGYQLVGVKPKVNPRYPLPKPRKNTLYIYKRYRAAAINLVKAGYSCQQVASMLPVADCIRPRGMGGPRGRSRPVTR